MRGFSTFALSLAAATAASGCAALRTGDAADAEGVLSWHAVEHAQGAEIVAEQPAPAPAGLVSFCDRAPSLCDTRSDGVVSYQRETSDNDLRHPVVLETNHAAAANLWSGAVGEDGAAIFSRLLAARAQGVVVRYEHQSMTLSEDRWRELRTVNRNINREIVAATDASQYGLLEYWAMPITEQMGSDGPVRGDCEDFALEKRERLIALGWDRSALALAVAYSAETGLHAVLIAQTDHGDFVLDNLHDEPLAPQNANYAWVSRQAGPAMTAWATARVEATPPAWEQTPYLLHAMREGSVPRAGMHEGVSDSAPQAASDRLVQVAALEPISGGDRTGFSVSPAGSGPLK